jgi:TonB-dependent SusC/RagA subfamily outer membrane receptor
MTTREAWIIDGVRLETRGYDASGNVGTNFGLSSIRPEDIESMDVIKGPAATAIYGTQASTGVIVIKTKRGKAGATTWNTYVESGLPAKFIHGNTRVVDSLVANGVIVSFVPL